jgi:glutaredoxin
MPKDNSTDAKSAILYRMVMPEHTCPYGLKSKDLLERHGYKVEDHHLKTKEETEAFKTEHDVKTTPQTFIDGQRIGGHDDLLVFFGKADPADDGLSYTPVIALFSVAALTAVAFTWYAFGTLLAWQTLGWFVYRDRRRHFDDRDGCDMAVSAVGTVDRHDWSCQRVQGRVHRQARVKMRLRWRRQQRATGFRIADRKSGDGRTVGRYAGPAFDMTMFQSVAMRDDDTTALGRRFT